MKNIINYYYNLYPERIYQNKDMYYFFIEDTRYIFIKYEEETNEMDKIYNLNVTMLKNRVYTHPIILNIENSPITIYKEKKYVLLKTIYYKVEKNIKIIMSFSKVVLSKEIEWGKLWSKKNDYLEFQIEYLGQDHKIIKESFNYYIGLGENAIELINILGKIEYPHVYAHKRIKKDIYNPLNIIIDLKTRDTAEYFKNQFFEDKDIKKELDYYLSSINNQSDFITFFSRMLYPTYYFDIFEEIITNRKKDEELIKIIEKKDSYEKLLKEIYINNKKFMKNIIIEWLE